MPSRILREIQPRILETSPIIGSKRSIVSIHHDTFTGIEDSRKHQPCLDTGKRRRCVVCCEMTTDKLHCRQGRKTTYGCGACANILRAKKIATRVNGPLLPLCVRPRFPKTFPGETCFELFHRTDFNELNISDHKHKSGKLENAESVADADCVDVADENVEMYI